MVKTIILGTKLMIDSINKFNIKPPVKAEQNKNGKLSREKNLQLLENVIYLKKL